MFFILSPLLIVLIKWSWYTISKIIIRNNQSEDVNFVKSKK
jgi:hypothetical protein